MDDGPNGPYHGSVSTWPTQVLHTTATVHSRHLVDPMGHGPTIVTNGVNRMRKSMSLFGAVVLVAWAATEASAADVTGVIQTIDPTANALTLSNGTQFSIGPTIKGDAFKPGDKVKVTFAISGKKRIISKLEAVK